MVFGDYHNDLEMMEQAKYSFAMGNAHADIKEKAQYMTKTNDEDGVVYILNLLTEERAKKTEQKAAKGAK